MCETIDFKEVYGWLNQFEEHSYLSAPVEHLICNLGDALSQSETVLARNYLDLLLSLSERNSLYSTKAINEKAEIHVECSRAFFLQGAFPEALGNIRISARLYSSLHPHNTVIAKWMMGCTFWNIGKASEAISIWKWCCDEFYRIGKRSIHHDWYEEKNCVLSKSLEVSIDNPQILFKEE